MNKQPVLYMQTDRRWKDQPYRVPGENATIGGSGCGPACAAMVISTLTGQEVTPVDTCAWSVAHGYKALNQGTYYGYFPPQLAAYGIQCKRLNTVSAYGKPELSVHDEAEDLLRDGYYIIACMGKGLWTRSGHFVLVWWADGKMYINDPASTKQERTQGDRDTFRSQVKYYWLVDARNHNKGDNQLTEEQVRAIVREEYEKMEAERAKEPPSDWAKVKLELARARGITDGSRPRSYATREEVAIMVNKVASD